MIPKGIYFVEEITNLVKENPKDDYFIIQGGVIKSIYRSGLKSILHTWKDKEYENLEVIESETSEYLRFEYEHKGRKEWLHVIKDGEEWY